MSSLQQDQTKSYFRLAAENWQFKAEDGDEDYNIIAGRNESVLDVIRAFGRPIDFLDVGCGTGQLVIDAAKMGSRSVGLDFAAEMIDICKSNLAKASVEATFLEASIFDYELAEESYDVISAQGFIEYIAPKQMMDFFEVCYRALRPGGKIVIGNRNRLFNAVSMNSYTDLEMALGTHTALAQEAMAYHMSTSQADAFEKIKAFPTAYPHPRTHPNTGVEVDTRYQYTPGDLTHRLSVAGF